MTLHHTLGSTAGASHSTQTGQNINRKPNPWPQLTCHLRGLICPSMLSARRRRRAHGDAARPPGAIDARPSQHHRDDRRQAAGFRSLGDAWADTTTAHGRLMLTVLGGLAEFERELIRVRTSEGRARAKANGKSLGRPFKMTPHQRREAIRRRDRGETLSDIARSYNVHPS